MKRRSIEEIHTHPAGQEVCGFSFSTPTQEALPQKSEFKYREVFDNTSDCIFIVDVTPNGRFKFVDFNPAEENAVGLASAHVSGKFVEDVVSLDLAERVTANYRRCVESGTTINYDESLRLPAGERHFHTALIPLRDSSGRIYRILGVARDISERVRSERALRESEERLRVALQAGRMYAYEWDVATDQVVRSEEYTTVLGLAAGEKSLSRQELAAKIHPADRDKFDASIASLTPGDPIAHASYRVLRSDGSVVWLDKIGRAYFDTEGKMVRMFGIVADITERKMAEDALSSVSRKLIEAQEKERTRIARELHDDIAQRFVLLAVELEQIKQDLPTSFADAGRRIEQVRKRITEISSDVQSISHNLHSSKLEYLGLVAAMKSFCTEFAEQQNAKVDFSQDRIPYRVPYETSLCLFRVLQESLHNAAKHSGRRHFEVELRGGSSEICLSVRDSGCGFNSDAARKGRGLGLTSMEERLKAVDGALSINSQPSRGTTVRARVPLNPSAAPETLTSK